MRAPPTQAEIRAALRLAEREGGVARLLSEMLAASLQMTIPRERMGAWRREKVEA